LPVHNAAGELIAVLDIDSDQADAFTEEDAVQLGTILRDTFAR
jgi:GAF domain-containing protein